MAGIGALGALSYGVLRVEAAMTRRIVGQRFESPPVDSGRYGSGSGEPVRFLVLGDSTAAGLGAGHPRETIGATIANGVAAFSGRSVEVTNVAVVGAESPGLEAQLDRGLRELPSPDVALVLIGANDVTHRIDRAVAVRHLEMVVRRLVEAGAEVVVGTCPDLGAVEPVPQPLRWLARRWSRDLAAAQTVAVVEAGGRAVSIGDLLGAAFSADPKTLFSEDRFHPSSAGYARVAAALLPSVCAALDLFGERTSPTRPSRGRGEGISPVARAATRAVAHPGTEVAPAEMAGLARGRHGRWAVLLHRMRPAVPVSSEDPVPTTNPPNRPTPPTPETTSTPDSAESSVDAEV
ncbi:MAG: lipolytic protein family [Humibacillus sp.]|nr:lipolytic protein family [Humibacillus sp.]